MFLSLLLFLFTTSTPSSVAQSVPTNIPLPPLQWLNLTSILRGASPPPLKDASIGYDDSSRSLLIFGGESQDGFVQSQTFLLNLDTLTWSTPSPPPTLQSSPGARSAAIGGTDFAASNRHGHVVIGGKGSNGKPLSDIWEYDYINQFWSQVNVSPGGPPPRWGASGGIDIRTTPISDPIVPGPNNTFFLAGGVDGTNSYPLSDVWELHIAGTLSSNLPNQVTASWYHHPIGHLPSVVGEAGTVLSQQIISAGGCNAPSASNNSCAQQNSYVINAQTNSSISPSPCPAPRLSAVLVPNMNAHSSSFSSQVFLLLGTFNSSLWNDDNGLKKGEVAVMDVNTGSWSRVLPSGDPGSTGVESFPGPREGSAAFSSPSALVGSSRSLASDTIVFGGRDSLGNYLSEVWLLRAYNDTISQSNQKWAGFANGQLQMGVDASGAGVTMQYLTKCAVAVPSGPTSSQPPSSSPASNASLYDTSIAHKILATLSIALLLPAILFHRFSSGQTPPDDQKKKGLIPVFITSLSAGVAYILGIVGLSSAFTSIRTTSSLGKWSISPNSNLKTAHGQAGLVLFVAFYGILPVSLLLYNWRRHIFDSKRRLCTTSNLHVAAEKTSHRATPAQSDRSCSPSPAFPLARLRTWKPSNLWADRRSRGDSDAESVSSAGASPTTPQRGFEVLNRPSRSRRVSGNSLPTHLAVPSSDIPTHRPIRSLGDIDWLERRRSLNAVGELDYFITQATRPQGISTPATTDALLAPISSTQIPEIPPLSHSIFYLLFHCLILGLCLLTLDALWWRAQKALFVIFLLWTLAFYVSIVVLAWYGRPRKSVLAVILFRLRAEPQPSATSPPSAPIPDPLFSPEDARTPYIHRPGHRVVGQDDVSTPYRRSVATPEEDDDEDEDTRQQRIEEEMGRRDVSIITVPKRKLWIANPT